MSEKKIIEVGYFKVNNKKNSVLENTKYQDNELNGVLDKIANLTEEIKRDISKSEKNDRKDILIDFTKLKNKKK